MTRYKDRTGRVAEIEMKVWEGNGYSPDWSGDFFETGRLVYLEDGADAYEVEDIEYLIEIALDWKYGVGDFAYMEDAGDPEDRMVWVNGEPQEREA